MQARYGSQSMIEPLRRVIVKRPEQAFRSAEEIQRHWKELGYLRPPDLERAIGEHRRLVALLEAGGAEVLCLPEDGGTGLDSIYTHDAALVTEAGAVILQTGKLARRGEGPALDVALRRWGVPVLGTVDGEATAEGGDLLWLDRNTLLAGRSFRTNAAGIAALRSLLGSLGVKVLEVHLPAFRGPEEILHLQSLISLLDERLAVVYRPLLPVPVLEILAERAMQLVEIPEQEFGTQGCNVLALRPRRVVMLRGNPVTRERIEAAGCWVQELDGDEIAFPGSGGPTCLTRPLLRA
jgi:N-dimethylarginine dimethylaminohydrolase